MKRDEALDHLEVRRLYLINCADDIARKIAKEKGSVTSTEVLEILRDELDEEMLIGVDMRFMGAVFRSGKGWIRLGWEATGSHCRPVSRWKLVA